MSTRRLSPICFVLSALCFLLTFSTVSCDDRPLASLSGIQLATGTTVRASAHAGPFESSHSERVPASRPVLLALLAAIAAAGVALRARTRRMQLVAGVLGVLGGAALILFRRDAVAAIAARSVGTLAIHFDAGFWGALLLMGGGAVAALHAATAREWETSAPLRDGDAGPAWPGVSS